MTSNQLPTVFNSDPPPFFLPFVLSPSFFTRWATAPLYLYTSVTMATTGLPVLLFVTCALVFLTVSLCGPKEKRKGVCSVSVLSAWSPNGLSRTLHGEPGLQLEGICWEDPQSKTWNSKHTWVFRTHDNSLLRLNSGKEAYKTISKQRQAKGSGKERMTKRGKLSGSFKDKAENTSESHFYNSRFKLGALELQP